MNERGSIQNEQRYRQVFDASDFRFGKVTPTDIDKALEIEGKAFVFMELKFGNAPMLDGQRKFLERLCDAITSKDRHAVSVIARHDVPAGENGDLARDCKVDIYWYKGTWKESHRGQSLYAFVKSFLKMAGVSDCYLGEVKPSDAYAELSASLDKLWQEQGWEK